MYVCVFYYYFINSPGEKTLVYNRHASVSRYHHARARKRKNAYWNVRNSSWLTWRIHKRSIHPTSPLLHTISLYIRICIRVCIPWHHRAHANNVCMCVSCYYYYIFFISLVFSLRLKVCSRGPEVVEFIIYIYINDTVLAVQKWRRSSGGRLFSTVTYVHNILWLRIYTGVYVYRRILPEQISSETRRRDNMRTAPTTVFLSVFEHRLTTV